MRHTLSAIAAGLALLLAPVGAVAGDSQNRDFGTPSTPTATEQSTERVAPNVVPTGTFTPMPANAERVKVYPYFGFEEALLGPWHGVWKEPATNSCGAWHHILVRTNKNHVDSLEDRPIVESYTLSWGKSGDCSPRGHPGRWPKDTQYYWTRTKWDGYFHFSVDNDLFELRRAVIDGEPRYWMRANTIFSNGKRGVYEVKAVSQETVRKLEKVYRELNPGTPDLLSMREE